MRTIGRLLLVFGLAGVSAVLAVSETAEVYAQDDKAGNEVTIKVKTRKWARDGTGTIKYEKLPGVRIIVSQNRVKRAGSKVVNERVGTFSTDKKDGVCVIPVKAGRPLTLVCVHDKKWMPEICNLSAEDGEVHQLSIALRPIAEYLIEEHTDPNVLPAWVKIRQIERILVNIIDPKNPKDPLIPALGIVREITKQIPAPRISTRDLDGDFPTTVSKSASKDIPPIAAGKEIEVQRELAPAARFQCVRKSKSVILEGGHGGDEQTIRCWYDPKGKIVTLAVNNQKLQRGGFAISQASLRNIILKSATFYPADEKGILGEGVELVGKAAVVKSEKLIRYEADPARWPDGGEWRLIYSAAK